MTPLSLVLDTNVVLDLFVFRDPLLQPLVQRLEAGTVSAWVDEHTLRELEYVLAYPQFRLDAAARGAVLARYQGLSRRVAEPAEAEASPVSPLPRCRDRDDQKFLELAARSGARWLVSKDKRVLSMADRAGLSFGIVSSRRVLALLPAG
ncbi:MAG: putative toxin-antitoxin system toxin component, PIN family [Cystobacter sp.]